MTEQEQIQQLKAWVKQYGPAIIGGIVLALVISFGWRYWQSYQDRILTHASGVYDELLTMRAQQNGAGTQVQAEKLLRNYPKTPYAQMASLMLAREAVQQKNYKEAITRLNWVIDHSKDKGLRQIARTRIARILIADNKPQEAITLLDKVDDKSFMGLINEIKGDAYLALNNPAAARTAYKKAVEELPAMEAARPILQMKLENLAV